MQTNSIVPRDCHEQCPKSYLDLYSIRSENLVIPLYSLIILKGRRIIIRKTGSVTAPGEDGSFELLQITMCTVKLFGYHRIMFLDLLKDMQH